MSAQQILQFKLDGILFAFSNNFSSMKDLNSEVSRRDKKTKMKNCRCEDKLKAQPSKSQQETTSFQVNQYIPRLFLTF
jgi:hypothetical protein